MDRITDVNASPVNPPTMNVDKGVGGGTSSKGSEMTGAATGCAKTALALLGEVAALPSAAVPVGQMTTTGGQEGDGSFVKTAAVARLEWIERQGNSDGLVDMEVRGASVRVGAGFRSRLTHTWRGGRWEQVVTVDRALLCAVVTCTICTYGRRKYVAFVVLDKQNCCSDRTFVR